ncbi:hypothetical protein [Microvirga alba]|uniref:Uncharacterized protein n=1 Tax=Microvirga alba TaxID=2791025 RepID=A0A931BSI6_9HYPH|nr:hypothetical protein [Microvirga alba]MBF9235213.1 hypothetical protein [Microvirga alba]
MPVLDAKALETDPEGAAFLLSVLRQNKQANPLPRDTERDVQVQFRWFRRRTRHLKVSLIGL